MGLRRFLPLPAVMMMLALPLTSHAARVMDAPKPPPTETVYEVDPGDRAGYIRVPGHWEWTGKSYRWVAGRWVEERDGFVWVGDSWAQRGKKWHFTPGYYEPDGNGGHATDVEIESRPEPSDATETTEPSRPLTIKDTPPKIDRSEMDTLEQSILAPSKNPNVPKKAPVKKQRVVKKIDYNDQRQFPRYRHH